MLNRTEVLQVVAIATFASIGIKLPKMWARKHLAQTSGSSGDVIATMVELIA
ncbi:MAG: hypothetical protein ACRDX8_15385 [Acidimicrobiales bacterium]